MDVEKRLGNRIVDRLRRPAQANLEKMHQPAGYLHPAYAASFSDYAQARQLLESRSSILTRAIPGTNLFDAMGCYPLFLCSDWTSLADDLSGIDDLVSLVVVTDPFADVSVETLRRCFPDVLRPFKEHFVVDLLRSSPSRRRRARTRRMLRDLAVEATFEPIRFLDEWERLYRYLCTRMNIKGMMAFSRQAFHVQLAVPGCVGFVARVGGNVVSMALWYITGDVAYYHLAASDEEGYRLSASHVLMQTAIEVMAEQKVRWLGLGAGAGTEHGQDGLTRFKQRWATGTRTAYLGGRIFRPADYAALAAKTESAQRGYFPAYRSGEFG